MKTLIQKNDINNNKLKAFDSLLEHVHELNKGSFCVATLSVTHLIFSVKFISIARTKM